MKERVFFEEFESLYYFHGSTQNWMMQDFHFHNRYEIILFLSDGATLDVGSRSYNVRCGDLFLLNNKEYHRTNGAVNKAYNRYVLMFEPELLGDMAEAFEYDFTVFFENRPGNFVHKLHLSEPNRKRIERLMAKIEQNISTKVSAGSRVKIKLAILELMLEINEMYEFFMKKQDTGSIQTPLSAACEEGGTEVKFKNPVLNRERIEQIKKYMSDHVEEKLELDDIAKEFYLSRYYLSHYFKKETGFTVAQYMTNKKLVKAKELLKKGHTVTEVANRLSYNSDSHFISVFKKSIGITPKQYAKEGTGNHKIK